MAKFIMKFSPADVMREAVFMHGPDSENLIKSNLDRYTAAPAIETHLSGMDAAEEAFDLTNNPSRQKEREQKYGRGRSLSSGDVVEVIDDDGKSTSYACMSFGWKTL